MSSDDEQGLGDTFFAETNENEDPVVYPIEEMIVDRMQLRREGKTNAGFTPLFDNFDRSSPDEDRINVELAPLKVYFCNKRHSLWGHKLWNAAKYIVKRIDSRMIDVRGKTVLELGAGLGVPSLAAFRNGARCVVVSDYPDAQLLEILEMNVKENCMHDMIDSDAHSFLLNEAKKHKLTLRRRRGDDNDDGDSVVCGDSDSISLTEEEIQMATNTHCVVEPLLWGKEEHIRQVLSHTHGGGFEIVLLSDILFNHICNDELVDTLVRVLQNSPVAAAYCVFSHHRAHKQVEDLEFFDKCVARGLRYVQLDEEDYPLMFPEDCNYAEIRQPVKAYKIMHCFDNAGMAFKPNENVFDVVIQGTGIVESFLSAACARSGLRVLQCDGADDYGGPFRTMTVEKMREFINKSAGDGKGFGGRSQKNSDNGETDLARHGVILVDRMDELVDSRKRQQYLLDLLPRYFLKNGEVVQQLASSGMARHLDFCCFSAFAFILPLSGSGFKLQSVPLTRAQVFAADDFTLLQKRRIMKFIKDVDASLAENLHARTANAGDDPFSETALEQTRAAANVAKHIFAQEARAYPCEMLSTIIERKYGLNGAALDTVTLFRQLDVQPVDVEHSIDLVRYLLTSIGKFGNMTPFIQPLYGASEISQNMCRIAAVWNATLVLRRSILPRYQWRDNGVVGDTTTSLVEMSNHQRIRAKVVVVPRTLASGFNLPPSLSACFSGKKAETTTTISADEMNKAKSMNNEEVRFSRVIMIARSPLLSWAMLRAAGCNENIFADGEDTQMFPPLVLALCQAQTGVVVQIQQVSSIAKQAPDDGSSVVLHFTANEWEMNATELQQFVFDSFVRRGELHSGETSLFINEDELLFFASFVVREGQEALRGIVNVATRGDENVSETRKAHPYAIEEYKLRQQKQKKLFYEEDDTSRDNPDDNLPFVLPVQTLFQNLIDDGAYLRAAQEAYDDVVKKLRAHDDGGINNEGKRYIFLERLQDAF